MKNFANFARQPDEGGMIDMLDGRDLISNIPRPNKIFATDNNNNFLNLNSKNMMYNFSNAVINREIPQMGIGFASANGTFVDDFKSAEGDLMSEAEDMGEEEVVLIEEGSEYASADGIFAGTYDENTFASADGVFAGTYDENTFANAEGEDDIILIEE